MTIGSYAIVSETSNADEMGPDSSITNVQREKKKHAKREKREGSELLERFCVTNCGTLHTEMQASATIMYLFHIKIVCWCTVYT